MLWGYLLHARASGRLLLIVDCPSPAALAVAARHPALAHLAAQPHRREAQRGQGLGRVVCFSVPRGRFCPALLLCTRMQHPLLAPSCMIPQCLGQLRVRQVLASAVDLSSRPCTDRGVWRS